MWVLNVYLNRNIVSFSYTKNIVIAGKYLREWRFLLHGRRKLNWLGWSVSSSHQRTFWSVPNPILWSLVLRPIGKWMVVLGRDCKNVIKNKIVLQSANLMNFKVRTVYIA